MIAQRRTPPPCFSSRAYSLRGDRAVPFRSLCPPGASLKRSASPLARPTSHRIFHDPRYLPPRNHKHECGTHFNLGRREIKRGHTGLALNAPFVFVPIATSCRALEPWLQFIASRVLPPQTSAHMLSSSGLPDWEQSKRSERVGGALVWRSGDGRGLARLGAPKWKPNGQLDGGVLVRVPRIADSV